MRITLRPSGSPEGVSGENISFTGAICRYGGIPPNAAGVAGMCYSGSASTGGSVFFLGDAEIQIVAPLSIAEDTNNNSLVLRIVYGDTAFFVNGRRRAGRGGVHLGEWCTITGEMCQVGHHGSDTSTGKALLDAVQPEYAAISTAWDTSRLPRESVLAAYKVSVHPPSVQTWVGHCCFE